MPIEPSARPSSKQMNSGHPDNWVETLGLVPHRDRLCVIQLSRADQRLGRASLTCRNVADSHTPGNNTSETRLPG
jgi:hypothetical protein